MQSFRNLPSGKDKSGPAIYNVIRGVNDKINFVHKKVHIWILTVSLKIAKFRRFLIFSA